jgi:predicted N-acyltransferase
LATLELSTHASLRDIGEAAWTSLECADTPPFLRWAFLDAMEQTRCVTPERGWAACHVSLKRRGVLVAVAPAYMKGNSEGEFVFDQGWAQFAEGRLGIPYYPKLIVASPFTPATGPRLLTRPGEDEAELLGALAEGLRHLTDKMRVSSAHVLFASPEQATALADAGMHHRLGVQYHFKNERYATFDDFLGRFNAKRRHQIRREMRAPAEQGLVLEVKTGRDLTPALIDAVYEFYTVTVQKYYWGRQYLNRAFFEQICQTMPDGVLVVFARHASSPKPIAGAFNLLGKTGLYGRYWGASEEHPFLHFNVCYYRGVVECIERGLTVFEPGAGGEHKLPRGFEPTITHSCHHLRDRRLERAVVDFLGRERDAVHRDIGSYESDPMLKPIGAE